MSTNEQPAIELEVMEVSTENTEETQERLKNIVKKLLQNKMDKVEVLSLAERMSLNVRNEESFSKQKYALQKAVLEQIMKKEPSEYFKQLLADTKEALQMKSISAAWYDVCIHLALIDLTSCI